MTNLLELLIIVSEKAANIARACRQNESLFSLLVEEKGSLESNARFCQDFKTLADVLIQETVRHDIKQHFPSLEKHITGEENNVFTNTNGDSIKIVICSCQDGTAKLLEKVLNGNNHVANVLAREVHRSFNISNVNLKNSDVPNVLSIDIDNLGIWIDPIDSTAEYINGKESKHESGIFLSGLQCVTVLIGAFDRTTGIPLIGVVNQPFHKQTNSRWEGMCYWGVCSGEQNLSSYSNSDVKSDVVVLSKVELNEIKSKLSESGFSLVEAAGAGYKLLTVISGLAQVYIISQGTTFRWDVCGPHAILRALGGGMFDYQSFIEGKLNEIDYKETDCDEIKIHKYCNSRGVLAVRNKEILDKLMQLLRK